MIKVLNVISDSNIGGAGRCVLNFLKHYDREKFKVEVAVPRGSLLLPEIKRLDTKAIEVDGIADRSLDLSAIGKLYRVVKEVNPKIVHTHGSVTGRICGRLCGKKVVYTRHSVFPVSPKISKGIGRFLNKTINEFLADEIIAVAEAAKDNLTEGGISPDKIQVILNGVEQIIPLNEEELSAEKVKYGIGGDQKVIGILARIEEVKGHKYLIEAAEKLRADGKDIKVLIAGTGSTEETLKRLVKEKQMEDTVIFTGFVQEIQKILSLMDIQANASFGTEATSLALLEGMSLGIPAVVSNYGGNPGVITHGENGFLFQSQDSADLAKYLEQLIDDCDCYQRMQVKCHEIYERKFTADIYARNIEKVYEALVR